MRELTGCSIEIGEEFKKECQIIIKGKTREDNERAKEQIYESLGYGKAARTFDDDNEDFQIDWGSVEKEYEEAQKIKWAKCPPLKKGISWTFLFPLEIANFWKHRYPVL